MPTTAAALETEQFGSYASAPQIALTDAELKRVTDRATVNAAVLAALADQVTPTAKATAGMTYARQLLQGYRRDLDVADERVGLKGSHHKKIVDAACNAVERLAKTGAVVKWGRDDKAPHRSARDGVYRWGVYRGQAHYATLVNADAWGKLADEAASEHATALAAADAARRLLVARFGPAVAEGHIKITVTGGGDIDIRVPAEGIDGFITAIGADQ